MLTEDVEKKRSHPHSSWGHSSTATKPGSTLKGGGGTKANNHASKQGLDSNHGSCHKRQKKPRVLSWEMVCMGIVALLVVAGLFVNLNEVGNLLKPFQEQMPYYAAHVQENTIIPHELKDGVLLAVRKPKKALTSLRQAWSRVEHDREALFSHTHSNKETLRGNGKAKGNSTLTDRTRTIYRRIVRLGSLEQLQSAFSSIWKQQRDKRKEPRSVYPIAEPPSDWEISNDVTRGYSSADSSDEEVNMEFRDWPEDEHDPKCKPMHDWQSFQFPVCNVVHESNLGEGITELDTSLLSVKGFWRHVWRKDTNNQTTVWKTFKLEHNMEDAFFENNRVDALAMERLTSSPYIIDVYAFCAMSVVQEFAGKEISSFANKLDPKNKLEIATKVAQAVVDIHSIGGADQPSLVHNDINLANLIFTEDGRPVLNDFNIAILLKKHNETGETCPFYFRFPNPQWRSPEEQIYSDQQDLEPPLVTEKVDVYGLGNVIYRLLVGQSPWKNPSQKKLSPEEKEAVAHLKHDNGTLPDIPQEVLNSTNPYIKIMRRAMFQCYRFNPKARPSARGILAILRNETILF
ncbi:hypothetical protein ACA910_021870 [Epithemia clementina (nom. ined.)]